MKKDLRAATNPWLIAFVLYVFFLSTLFNPALIFAQQQSDCAAKLQEARGKFNDTGDSEAVIALLEPCVSQGKLGEVVLEVEAYELLGQSYLQLGYTEKAKKTVEEIYHLVPQYSPEKPFGEKLLPNYKNLAKEKLDDLRKGPGWWERNWKYVVGYGIVAAGTGVAYLIVSSGDEKTLPQPPNYPTGH